MGNFWDIVRGVIKASDVVLLLIDARMVEETRNVDIEKQVREQHIPLIYTVTKSDLVAQNTLNKWRTVLNPCVFVSSTKYQGLALLNRKIFGEASRAGIKGPKISVGVLGYPNVGKSSLVNAMTGRGCALSSNLAGFTKAKKSVTSLRGGITFVDTPGIIPLREKDAALAKLKHAMIGAIDYRTEKEPDAVVLSLLKTHPGVIEKHYKVPVQEDGEETLASIATKRGLLRKGNTPDVKRVSTMILKHWQAGNIRQVL